MRPATAPRTKKHLPGRVFLLLLFALALMGASVAAIQYAGRENWRREAYLPDLEAEAKRDPSDGKSLALLAARLAEAREYPAAAQTCEQAVGAGIREPALWLTWASCYAASGDNAKARGVLSLGINSGRCQPSGPARDALRRLETLLSASEQTGRTPDPTAVAATISPDGTRPLVALYAGGSFLNFPLSQRQRSDPERSGFTYRQQDAAGHPDDPLAQSRWVEALCRNRRLREAESVGSRAVQRWPDAPEVHLAYGQALFLGHVYAKAGLQYKAALALRPDWLPALKGLGAVGVEMSLYRISLDNYEKAVKVGPEDAEAWIGLGRARLQEAFRLDQALEAFQNAARLAPERTDFFPYYADALTYNYKPDEAEALLRRRLKDAPDDARSHYLLASNLLKNKMTPARSEEAERLLRESLRLENAAPIVKVTLAQVLLEKGTPDAAADAGILLAEALDADPRNTLAMRLLSQAYRRIGRLDRAEEAEKRLEDLTRYNEAVGKLEDKERSRPEDIAIHAELARVYAQGGEPEKARRQNEMVYMLEHHPEDAKRGLAALMGAVSKTQQDVPNAPGAADVPAKP